MQYNLTEDGQLAAHQEAELALKSAPSPSRASTGAMGLDRLARNPKPVTLSLGAVPLNAANDVARVGRNDICPCGSGKKYKKCHGA
ncbi:MAG: SEC-C metal-binding domain-containing protein [Bdellovibrionia bacterium]